MTKYFCTFVICELGDETASWLCDAADRDEAESLFWEFARSQFEEYNVELIAVESLADLSHSKSEYNWRKQT